MSGGLGQASVWVPEGLNKKGGEGQMRCPGAGGEAAEGWGGGAIWSQRGQELHCSPPLRLGQRPRQVPPPQFLHLQTRGDDLPAFSPGAGAEVRC